MFVLQDCSICMEDYDAGRCPYTIPCGHVFCHPCLDTLTRDNPTCPQCRTDFTSASIHKIVCTFQNPPSPPPSPPTPLPPSPVATINNLEPSEAEAIMWQAMSNAIENENEHDQRQLIVLHNLSEDMREQGMSEGLVVALDIMRALVNAERVSHGLSRELDTARAVEESLRDRINEVETELSTRNSQSSANVFDFQALVSEIQKLGPKMNSIELATSHIRDQLASNPRSAAPSLPAQGINSYPTPSSSPSLPRTLRQSTFISGDAQPYRNQSSPGQETGRAAPAFRPPSRPRFESAPPHSNPFTSNTITPTSAMPIPQLASSMNPPPYSTPSPVPSTQNITTAYAYNATTSQELSFRAGERLELTPESDLSPNGDWVWCRNGMGEVGYAPRGYLLIVE